MAQPRWVVVEPETGYPAHLRTVTSLAGLPVCRPQVALLVDTVVTVPVSGSTPPNSRIRRFRASYVPHMSIAGAQTGTSRSFICWGGERFSIGARSSSQVASTRGITYLHRRFRPDLFYIGGGMSEVALVRAAEHLLDLLADCPLPGRAVRGGSGRRRNPEEHRRRFSTWARRLSRSAVAACARFTSGHPRSAVLEWPRFGGYSLHKRCRRDRKWWRGRSSSALPARWAATSFRTLELPWTGSPHPDTRFAFVRGGDRAAPALTTPASVRNRRGKR